MNIARFVKGEGELKLQKTLTDSKYLSMIWRMDVRDVSSSSGRHLRSMPDKYRVCVMYRPGQIWNDDAVIR
jgi:hypothetical protein